MNDLNRAIPEDTKLKHPIPLEARRLTTAENGQMIAALRRILHQFELNEKRSLVQLNRRAIRTKVCAGCIEPTATKTAMSEFQSVRGSTAAAALNLGVPNIKKIPQADHVGIIGIIKTATRHWRLLRGAGSTSRACTGVKTMFVPDREGTTGPKRDRNGRKVRSTHKNRPTYPVGSNFNFRTIGDFDRRAIAHVYDISVMQRPAPAPVGPFGHRPPVGIFISIPEDVLRKDKSRGLAMRTVTVLILIAVCRLDGIPCQVVPWPRLRR
ncbi:hypothetical protein ACXYMO_02610 [Arenibacterium sp. CAU 1754]